MRLKYQKPNGFYYRVAQAAAWVLATCVFRRTFLRNELKGKRGPFVVIANHQAALDFVTLIGATRRKMTFVISQAFYSTLPIKGILNKLGVIPKQQFQTTTKDLKRMKAVIEHGEPLVIYPAGLMCEDGLSTPIPSATYKFLKWMDADVYVARTSGTYFVMPKWGKGMRPGKTHMDIYRLFTREELAELDVATIQKKTDEALLFDAYREQETLQVVYKGGNIEGIEHVLYRCPHCGTEFSVRVENGNTLVCDRCGFAEESDQYGFLHNRSGVGEEVRYVSDWSRFVYESAKELIVSGRETELSCAVTVRMVDHAAQKFCDVGQGVLTLSKEGFLLDGTVQGEAVSVVVPITQVPILPFSPGKHLELQQGDVIYRCVPEDGHLVMKFIHFVKAFYEINKAKRDEKGTVPCEVS